MSIETTSRANVSPGNFASMLDQLTGLSSNSEMPNPGEFSIGDNATDYQPSSASREKALKLARHLSIQLNNSSKIGKSSEFDRASGHDSTSTKEPRKERINLASPLPLTGRTPLSSSDAQGIKMSYEDALRIHSRRQSPSPASTQVKSPKAAPTVRRQATEAESKASKPAKRQEPRKGKVQAKPSEKLQTANQATIRDFNELRAKTSSNANKGRLHPQRASLDSRQQANTSAKHSHARALAIGGAKSSQGNSKAPVPKVKHSDSSSPKSTREVQNSKAAPVLNSRSQLANRRISSQNQANDSQSVKRTSPVQSTVKKKTEAAIPIKARGKLRDSSVTSVRTRTHTYFACPPKSPDMAAPQIRSRFKDCGLPDRSLNAKATRPSSQDITRSAQRKSMVSMRLNQAEMNSIRVRAEESGVSVCAYIRLCVLEAEQLRAQVKLALSAIRSGINSDTSNNEPLPKTEQFNSAHFSPWLIRLKGFAAEVLSQGFRRSAGNGAARTSNAIS